MTLETQSTRLNRSPYLKPLIFADPGAGKTVLAGSSPNALLIRPPTDGTESLEKFGYECEEMEVETWAEMDEVYDHFSLSKSNEFEWCWLDGISLFQEYGLDDIMDELVRPVEKGGKGKIHREPYNPGIENYGTNMNHLSKWIRQMVTLPINFGVTAIPERVEDRDGEVTYMPYVQGKNMSAKISGYFGLVANLRVVKGDDGEFHRVLYVQKDGKWYAKDRYNLTDKGYIVDPTIPKIVDLREKARGARTKKAAKKTTKKTASRKAPAKEKPAKKAATRKR